jgi:hypothetical protein
MQTTDTAEKTGAEEGSPPKPAAREIERINLSERLALSPREFAAAVGRSPTFAYRQIYAGRIRPISNAGRLLIPRSEIDRFLGRAAEYNPKNKARVPRQAVPVL